MANFYSFESMKVWQESRKLCREIRALCKRENVRKDWPFTDQITRSVRSISVNIAEGSDSMTIPEFISFLGFAKRSATETRSHLYDVLDEHYITTEEFEQWNDQCKKICSMLAKLIHHLQSLNPAMKRTYNNI